jgi:multidrug resistance efflux pump
MFRFPAKLLLSLTVSGLFGASACYVVQAQPAWRSAMPQAQAEPAPKPVNANRTITARGTIEAPTANTVIGSAVAGVVEEVSVTAEQIGQTLPAGTPLFRVEERGLRAQLKLHEATLAAAEAQLAKLEAEPRREDLAPYETRIRTAQANLAMLDDQCQRSQRLRSRQALSEEEYSQRRLAREVCREQLAQAKADLEHLKAGASEADEALARATVEQARAQVEQTRSELDRCLVRAPEAGMLSQINVRVGEYVGTPPNQPLIMLSHPGRLQVRVEIDERDLPRFRPEQSARASLRGQSGTSYPLQLVRVEPGVITPPLAESESEGRVLPVIYTLNAPNQPVYVGQQVEVRIAVRE